MDKIRWDDIEIDQLAKSWVQFRVEFPFANQMQLLQMAQEKCFAANRRRNLTSLGYVKNLEERIMVHWTLAVKAEVPPPRIIEVPVEKPVDYRELLNRLPVPTLIGMAVEKALETFKGIPATNGHAPVETTGTARTSIQNLLSEPAKEAKKIPPRVAVCTPDGRLFSQLQEAVKKNGFDLELRHVDLDTRSPAIPTSVNYVLFPHLSHASPTWKAAREDWPRKSIVEVGPHTGTLFEATLQELRNLNSRTRPAVVAK